VILLIFLVWFGGLLVGCALACLFVSATLRGLCVWLIALALLAYGGGTLGIAVWALCACVQICRMRTN
jgi:hypothetical protein